MSVYSGLQNNIDWLGLISQGDAFGDNALESDSVKIDFRPILLSNCNAGLSM